MSLSVGIVGLPNVGKSTLFNALVSRRLSPTAVHPFTTIEPHEAVVPVPDEKLTKLSELVSPEKTTPATITFIDIAGLVKDAHKGEGLGNQFLAKIREVDAIVHVVRDFKNENVSHVSGSLDPQNDIEIVNGELHKAGIDKPTLYVLNISESDLTPKNTRAEIGVNSCIIICARLEEDLTELSPEERREYLREVGVEESGLEKLIRESYKLLNLITFYTIKGGKEVRVWSLKRGSTALSAADKVHTDFAQKFIKAEVVNVEELLSIGNWNSAKGQGRIRLEGKDYQVQDGDVVEFRVGG